MSEKKQLIAKDTPEAVIEALKKIDFEKLTDKRIDDYLAMIDRKISEIPGLISRRKELNVPGIRVDIPGCPERVLKKISRYKFSMLFKAFVSQTGNRQMIDQWITQNLPLRG